LRTTARLTFAETTMANESSQQAYPVAPWLNRQDERSPNVHLFEIGDGWKTTIEPTIDGEGFQVVDWEVFTYDDGHKVWTEAVMFTVSIDLANALFALSQQNGEQKP
jgi:hypothetical protein